MNNPHHNARLTVYSREQIVVRIALGLLHGFRPAPDDVAHTSEQVLEDGHANGARGG